jgi:hypothetical protein
MSSSNNGVTLKSFAELATVIERLDLNDDSADNAANENYVGPETQGSAGKSAVDLATLLAQLAEMSSGLEATARQDARAREQAALEMAQYEALVAERCEAEGALGEARRLRTTAEQLVGRTFTDELRARATQHAAAARAAELACAELLAERTRAADELASRPYLRRVLTERRQQAEAEAARTQQQADERERRLAEGLERASQALRLQDPEQAMAILRPLRTDHPDHPELRRLLGTAAWQEQQRVVVPAEAALRETRSRAGRDEPEWAMARLAGVPVVGLPDDLGRQLLAVWLDACFTVVQQRGWHEPRLYVPQRMSGVVLARETATSDYQVVSALGLPDWNVGDAVTSAVVLRAARPLEERKRTRRR